MMLLAAATTVTAVSSSARAAQKVGACEDIKTMSPYVEEIGNWAVTAFNELTDEKLKFRGVVRGCKQVVAGTNYELDVETEGPASASYLSGSYLVKVFDPLPSSTEGRQLKKFVKVLL
nr:unnamed protein product [Digitaria exilis]